MRGNTCKICPQKSVWPSPEKQNITFFLFSFFLMCRHLCVFMNCGIFCRIIPHTQRLAKTSTRSITLPPLMGHIWPRTAWMAQGPQQPTSCKIPPPPWQDRLLNFTQVCTNEMLTAKNEILKSQTLHPRCNLIDMQTNVRLFSASMIVFP